MKKLSIFLLGALGVMATSCLEKVDPAAPQSNPQEPILAAGDITSAKAGALEAGKLILEEYTAAGAAVPVMQTVETKDLPAGATVSYKVEISKTEDFARSVALMAEPDADGVCSVNAADWNEAHIYLFGKSPKPQTAYYRVPVYVNVDGTDYRYQSTSYYAAEGTLSETCMDSGFVIEDAYYFLSNGTTWDLAAAKDYPFNHDPEVSVYDDPVFTIVIDVTEEVLAANGGGDYWKIAPQSAVESGDWATVVGPEVDGDENYDGMLTAENPGAGKLTEAGKFKVTINMEEMTYSIEKLLRPEVLYTPGDANGWSQVESPWMAYSAKNGMYNALFPVGTWGFKICTEPSWDDNVTFGAATEDPALAGTFVMGGAGKNIMVPNPGAMYWCQVEFNDATFEPVGYTLTEVTTVGMIGSMTSWGSDVVMTSADGGATWTADYTFAAGDQFKFRFNSDWGMNYGAGAKAGQLAFDEGNLAVEEAGEYTVTLILQPGLPTYTMTKK